MTDTNKYALTAYNSLEVNRPVSVQGAHDNKLWLTGELWLQTEIGALDIVDIKDKGDTYTLLFDNGGEYLGGVGARSELRYQPRTAEALAFYHDLCQHAPPVVPAPGIRDDYSIESRYAVTHRFEPHNDWLLMNWAREAVERFVVSLPTPQAAETSEADAILTEAGYHPRSVGLELANVAHKASIKRGNEIIAELEAELARAKRTITTYVSSAYEQTDRAVAAENALDALQDKYDIDMGAAAHADAILTRYVTELVVETNVLKRDLEAANAKVAALEAALRPFDAFWRERDKQSGLFKSSSDPSSVVIAMNAVEVTVADFNRVRELLTPPDDDPTPPAGGGDLASDIRDDESYPALDNAAFDGVGAKASDTTNFHGGFEKPRVYQGEAEDRTSTSHALIALLRSPLDIGVNWRFESATWQTLKDNGFVFIDSGGAAHITASGKDRAEAMEAPAVIVHDLRAAAHDDGRDDRNDNVRNINRLSA